ncbi:hypothetical protein ACM7VC_15100 [Pseudomonas aeruginosa]
MSRVHRSVVAYAFLAQANRSDGDLLSGLMPIFKPIAKLHQGETFNPAKFSELVADLYGLNVSSWAVESLAPRLEAAGVLTRIKINEQAHEYVYSQIEEEYSEVTEKDVQLVLDKFVEFARPLVEGHEGLKFEPEVLKESFLAHIVDLDFVGTILRPIQSLGADGKPKLGLPKSAEQTKWEQEKINSARIDTLCASFVLDLHNKEPELYALVCRITAGAMVSEVVLNFQSPETGISLSGLRVILDTPFLMDLLNLSSKGAFEVSSSICKQLLEKGARLAVFRHSIEEMTDNLAAVMSSFDAGEGYGPTARRLHERTFRTYAGSIKTAPEIRLKQESIEIIEAPSSQQAYGYFTDEDERKLFQSLGFFQNKRAQERDAASVAGTMRLRSGTKARMGKFQACKVLFVTENPWVAKKSQDAMVRWGIYDAGDVPAAITDRYLAGLLWVLYGGTASKLPVQVLLANCAAAVEPKTDLIQRMHQFLSNVDEKQADYFKALMTEERGSQYLSKLSLGDSSYISQDNASLILEQMKNSLLEKSEAEWRAEREKHEEQIEIINQQHSEKIEELKGQIISAETDLLLARGDVRTTQEMVGALTERLEEQERQRIKDVEDREEKDRKQVERGVIEADKFVRRLTWGIAFIVCAITIIGSFIPGINSIPYSQLISIVISVIVFFLCFWKLPDYIFGRHIETLRDGKLRAELERRGVELDKLDDMQIDWDKKTASRVKEKLPK